MEKLDGKTQGKGKQVSLIGLCGDFSLVRDAVCEPQVQGSLTWLCPHERRDRRKHGAPSGGTQCLRGGKGPLEMRAGE